MRAVFEQVMREHDESGSHVRLQIELEVPFLPVVGMTIYFPGIFTEIDDPYEFITQYVGYDARDGKVYCDGEHDEYTTDDGPDMFDRHVRAMIGNGWKVVASL